MQTSANGGHSDIRGFNSEFRALISTENEDALDNTATTGTGVPIYWLNGDKVADDYAGFYDGNWDSVAGTDESGGTWVTESPRTPFIWTGSNSDGTKHETNFPGSSSSTLSRYGQLRADRELNGARFTVKAALPLYALPLPVLTLSQAVIPGLTLSPATVTLAEGATTTYTAVLDSQPTGTVTVTIASNNPDVILSATTLSFTTDNWNTAQTVTLTTAEDADAADDVATLTHTAAGGGYAGIEEDLSVTVTDNDSPAITLMPTSLTVDEGANTDTYTAVLDTQPSDTVTVTIASNNTDVTTAPTTLTFTTENWDMAQSVTITAADDADSVNDDATLTHTAGGGDYTGITASLSVTVIDDESPGLSMPATLTVGEGTDITYSVVLNTVPIASVTVTIGTSGDVTTTPGTLTFTTTDWETPQSVTVSAAGDDDAVNDVVTLTHTAASTDSNYGSVTRSLPVTVADDDTRGLSLMPALLTLTEGTTATYTAVLISQPTDTVTVTIASDNTDVTTMPAALIFTTSNWDTVRSVIITAAEDDDTSEDDVVLRHTAAGGDYGSVTANLSVTVTDTDTDTDTNTNTSTTRMNEQILTRAASAMTASTLAAVGARVESAADGGSGKPLAFQLDGRSSLHALLEKNGKAMLEDTMDYERLLDGASFVLPLSLSATSAADNASAGTTGKTTVWGSSDFRNLADDEGSLDWEGQTLSAHLGIDKRFSEQALAGLALSWNDASFDYVDDADNSTNSTPSEGEYQYSVVTIHPYFGWSNDGLKLWGTVGFGQGEITIDQEGDDELSTDTTSTNTMSTDTTQLSFAGGFNHRLTDSPGGSVHIKGDIALTQVAVEAEAGKFDQQDIASSRLRLLLSSERRGELASGGALSPSLEVGVRSDGGDGTTGTGIEIGGGLRYANPGGTVAVAGNIRTLLAGDYDELGADFSVRLSSKSGRGLSLTLHPVWGRTQSVADRLWNDGTSNITAGEITAGEITGGDAALQGSVDTEVGYGMPATMLGSPGILTPYTGITAQHGGSSRLRLGGRFADGNGLSLNLEGAQKNTTDGASHQVLLRGEVGF